MAEGSLSVAGESAFKPRGAGGCRQSECAETRRLQHIFAGTHFGMCLGRPWDEFWLPRASISSIIGCSFVDFELGPTSFLLAGIKRAPMRLMMLPGGPGINITGLVFLTRGYVFESC